MDVTAGDRLTILTPGGGGHGSPLALTANAGGDVIGGRGGEGGEKGEGDEEDPDRKARREAEMRLSGSVSGHRLGQEQA